MATPPSTPEHTSHPLVHCRDCGFAWYGRTAAHGLSVIGRCSRCRGTLEFHGEMREPQPQPQEPGAREQQPWEVLGLPTSWDVA
jgi:hypothetical protein